MTATVKTPTGLRAPGKALWSGIVGKYELRRDELRVLEDAAREADLIAQLDAGLTDQPLLIFGSQGQQVIHPVITELRQHRATLASLLRQLKLPDESGEVETNQHRAAAVTKWSQRGA